MSVSCVSSGLATSRTPVQVVRAVHRIRNFRINSEGERVRESICRGGRGIRIKIMINVELMCSE
jgi:hypothetical protein